VRYWESVRTTQRPKRYIDEVLCTSAVLPKQQTAADGHDSDAIDDRSRIVYSEIHDDEQAVTAAAFWVPRRLMLRRPRN
jgi:hypothetical protein